MKLEEIKNKTNEAVSYLVAALESGQSDAVTGAQLGYRSGVGIRDPNIRAVERYSNQV